MIVTGCLGAKEDQIREVHPKVLEITGPHSYEQVLSHAHQYVPRPQHNPFLSLVPEQGVKLTPRHFAYLKISEGCNHRCTFCIIPSLRGDPDSRPIGAVLDEAKRLVEAGVEEGAIGRSMADAPEIDGAVYLNGEKNVKPDDIIRVKVENADEYDLWGSKRL